MSKRSGTLQKGFRLVLTLPALKVQQFSLEFYLLNLAAADIERPVRFEVLGEAGVQGKKPIRRSISKALPVYWEHILAFESRDPLCIKRLEWGSAQPRGGNGGRGA